MNSGADEDGAGPVDLTRRTRSFALRIIRLYPALPKTEVANVLGRQILRSGTSIGAHYREAKRSRSDAEFISKLGGALMEAEETAYWLELIAESGTLRPDRLVSMRQELDELIAILVTCHKTAKRRRTRK